MLTIKLCVGTSISLCRYNLSGTYCMDLQYHIWHQKCRERYKSAWSTTYLNYVLPLSMHKWVKKKKAILTFLNSSLLFSSVLSNRMKWYTKYTGCNVKPFKTSLGKYIPILPRLKVLSSCASFTEGLETALRPIAFYA